MTDEFCRTSLFRVRGRPSGQEIDGQRPDVAGERYSRRRREGDDQEERTKPGSSMQLGGQARR
jgi:hypothetical protein